MSLGNEGPKILKGGWTENCLVASKFEFTF